MFNCAPHFDYKTTFTPRLNQAYLVDFQSYYVRICSYTVDPFLIFEKGSPEGNLIGVQTRTFSESKEQKKVCKSTTYTLFEQLRTVLSGERGIRTPGPVTVNGFQDRRNRPLCHLSAANVHPKAVLEPINPPRGPSRPKGKGQGLPNEGYTDPGSLDIVPAVRCRKRRIRKMADRSSPPAKAIHIPYKP